MLCLPYAGFFTYIFETIKIKTTRTTLRQPQKRRLQQQQPQRRPQIYPRRQPQKQPIKQDKLWINNQFLNG